MVLPSLTWDIVRDMLARVTARPPAWTHAATWTVDTLESRLGDDWPALVMAKSPDRSAGDLAFFAGHTIAYAHILEFALRLVLLDGIRGHAKVRRAIATDPRPDQLSHVTMQLELAGLALQRGYAPELEPRSLKSDPPADIAFHDDDGERIVVETRAILMAKPWREETRGTDELFERIGAIGRRHRVRCQGHIARLPEDAAEADALLALIDDHARLVALGANAPPLRFAGGALQIVRVDHRPAQGLTGPTMHANSWERIAQRISEKAKAARASGATWLSLEAHDGLWQFTDWGHRPLATKLRDITAVARPLLGGLHGLVISSGSAQRQGEFVDEDVSLPDGAHALRRLITPLRVRETLIVPADDTTGSTTATAWRHLYAAEPAWLAWALDQLDLPSPDEIFVTQ
jgi:hypothetical protein